MLGTGIQTDPYIIENETDLKNMKNNPEANYKLVRNIDLNGQIWTNSFNFLGSLDGNGYIISNFILNDNYTSSFFDLKISYPFRFSDVISGELTSEIQNITFSNFQIVSEKGNSISLFRNIHGRNIKNVNIQDIYIQNSDTNPQINIIAFETIGSNIDQVNVENITTDNQKNSFYRIFQKICSYNTSDNQVNLDANIQNINIQNINGYINAGILASNIGGFHYYSGNSQTNFRNISFKNINLKNTKENMDMFCSSIGTNTKIENVVFKNVSMINHYNNYGGTKYTTFGKEIIRSNIIIQDIYWKDINVKGKIQGVNDYFYNGSGLICGKIGDNSYVNQKNVAIKNLYGINVNFEEMNSFWISKIGEDISNLSIENIYASKTDTDFYTSFFIKYYLGEKYQLIGEDLSGNNYQNNITKLPTDDKFDPSNYYKDMKIKSNYVGFDFNNVWGIKANFNDGFPYLVELEEPPPLVGKIQFVGEKIIDIIDMLADTMGKKININNEGKFELISRRDINNIEADYIYNNSDNIEWYDSEWNDSEIVTQVKVTGRDVSAPRQVVQKEKLLVQEHVLIPPGNNDRIKKNFYYSNDRKTRAVDIKVRVDVEDVEVGIIFGFGPKVSVDGNDEWKVISKTPYYTRLYFNNDYSALSDGEYDVKIYGKPIAEIPPGQIQGIAENTELISKYGIITKEIDNPLLQNFEIVQAKAEEELFFNNIKTKKIKVKLLSDIRIQPGKIISVYHSVYQTQIKLYVSEVSHRSERGSEDSTTITGFIL
jgi:hypothetical protein